MHDKQENKRFEQLRKMAEDMLRERADGDESPNLAYDFNELLHELEVHQIELEMQHAELERAYSTLERTQGKFNDLFDFAPVGYTVTNSDGIIQQANLTIAAMLGADRGKLIGKKHSSFLDSEHKEIYYLHRRAVFQTQERQSCDLRMQRQDGSHFFAHLNSEIVPEEPGTCRTSITDVSQIKQAESSLKRSLEREKELNALRSRLIEVISHEMRTPLSTILSSIDILDRYSDRMNEAKREERYERIRNYVGYLTDVIDDVVIAHRASDDSPIVRTHEFDVVAVFRHLVEDISLLDNNQDRVEVRIRPTDESRIVTWDQNLFRRVIVNLLQNALKYSDGAVKCSLMHNKQRVVLRVQDEGGGIPEADREYIFDMFYRGDNTLRVPGTGVGLTVAKAAVEAHDGTIRIKSDTSGTTFTVILPCHVESHN